MGGVAGWPGSAHAHRVSSLCIFRLILLTRLIVIVANKKLAQFRTHYVTKELAYVSTQQSGLFDTFLFNHFSVHCKLA